MMRISTNILLSPVAMWPLYGLAVGFLLRGAFELAVAAYLLSVVLAACALMRWQLHPKKRRQWLLALPVFWILAYPACMLAHGARPSVQGNAYLHTLLGIVLGVIAGTGAAWAIPYKNGQPPKDIANMALHLENDTEIARKAAVMAVLEEHPYRPPWWLRNQHAQTLWSPLFRRQAPITHTSERVETPDGDFLYLHFHPGESGKPLLLLLHGLEGNARSPYITGIKHTMHTLGWGTLAMEFRSCSGVINDTLRIYHMGETGDLDFVARLLAERHPDTPLYILGVSLGGNVLGKWLGETADNMPETLRGAALISPPFNPSVGAPSFHEIFFGLYVKNFLRTLIPKALEKERQFPGSIDVEKVKHCTDFYTYDTEVTARLHGFEDAWDYWEKVGCHQFLDKIRVPTLLLTSEDDPFNPPETIPRDIANASPWLYPQWTTHGGHVGFVQGASPMLAESWFELQTARFFEAINRLDAH